MFKNSQKITISKHFLIPLLFIVLLFTSFGMCLDDAYASDLNESADLIKSELNVEDKLENSQENVLSVNEIEETSVGSVENKEVLGAVHTLNGGTYTDLRRAIINAKSGDTIKLSGTFYPDTLNHVTVDKKLTIISDTQATLDGNGKAYIFSVNDGAAGVVFKNLKLINGYRDGVGAAMFIGAKNVQIINCEFQNNHGSDGGAIYSAYNSTRAENLLIENCKFYNNSASQSAGAVGAYGNNSRVINCIFDSNYVEDHEEYSSFGGALQLGLDYPHTTAYAYNCKFYNNRAGTTLEKSHGGASCVRDGDVYENCIFVNNSAAQGGALTYHASGLIKNCTFINNSAIFYGGALSTGYLYNSMNLSIVNCSFDHNSAPIGGAAQLKGVNINISNSNFNENHAFETGGAINIDAHTVIVDDSLFNRNVANVDGGAVFITGENTLIHDSSFRSNEAIPDLDKIDDGLGGAIYINSTQATVENNEFYYNTARNGSAIYYDKFGENLKLVNNILFENQAWVYALPIFAKDIYYGETEQIKSIIHGGNNIADYDNLAVSNAIYNAADNQNIVVNGETPVSGATTSGKLYQDDREYNIEILMTVVHEDGTVVYNNTLNSNCFGEVFDNLTDLKVGKYYVTAKHDEDTYYKAITNATTFAVIPKVDNKVKKLANGENINYEDVVVWTLNITNNGPNNATNVVVTDVLPDGLIWLEDDTGGKYDPKTGILKIDFLEVGDILVVNIITLVNKTGTIVNQVNITAEEYDYNLTNNFDEKDINVPNACDLAVVKVVNESAPNFNDLVKWTITVVNNGPNVAHDVVVRDVLPKSLIFVSSDGNYDNNSGIWNVGTLNVGSSVKLNIISRVNAIGVIENEVSVSGREYDNNMTNNHDSEIVSVDSACDLAISKLVNVSVADFGDLVKWTLVVSNNGPSDATGVVIGDVLPNGFVYVSSTKPYRNGVINIGSLAVGQKQTVDIVSRVNATGSFVNVANVSGNEYDHDLSNNVANKSILIKPATDLSVVKVVNESMPNFNDLVKWTVSVVNNGPDVAHDVVVSDLLPDSLVWVSDNGAGKYNHVSGKWNIGTLNVASSVKLEIISRVAGVGMIENEVSVSGREYDYDMTNNHDSEIVSVDSACDLAISKLVNVSVADFGDLVKWTLVVSNNGPSDATSVVIGDVLPNGFVYVSSTKPYSNGIILVGNLASGKSVSVDIVSRVNATGSFVNVANVSGNEFDHDLSNNVANKSILINPATDLAVVKMVNESSPEYGNLVRWTISVVNNGPDVAHDVVVSDLLPDSLVWVSDNGAGKYNHVSGKWNVGTLNVGSSVKLNIVSRVNAIGVIENEVSVSGREYDYDMTNNHDSEIVSVDSACDLAISKLVNVSVADFGDLVKWTLVVSNNGPSDATGVVIGDVLPNGFVYVSSTKPYRNGFMSIGNLASGKSVSVDIVSRVSATGSFVNVANVSGNEYDHDLSNNVANKSILINPASDLLVIKEVNESSPEYGDLVRWTISVVNNGPDVAHDVVVSDLLPDSLVWVSDNGAGKYNHVSGKWNVGTLNNGGRIALDIITKVNATGLILNNASVSAREFDYNKSNNFDDEIIDVANASDLTIVKFANVSIVNYHGLVKWTVVVSNKGPNNATGVYVNEILPDGLILVNYTATKGFYDNGIWSICCMSKGEIHTLELICFINKTGDINNIVNVTGNEYDPDLSNNDDEQTIYVPNSCDVEIVKTVDNSNPYFGDVVEWNITISNNGPDSATDVYVQEHLPMGLTFLSYVASKGVYSEDKWYVESLDNGESASLLIRCQVNTLKNVNNVVDVSATEYDWNKSNNKDNEMLTPNPVTDLSIIKLVNVSVANYLDLVKWTLIVTNEGPNDATGVFVSDVIDNGLKIVKTNGEGKFDDDLWDVGDLKSGQSKKLEIICKIIATGEFNNFASVWGNEYDPDLSNNEDEESLYVNPASDLSITKTVSKYRYYVGDLVKYSIKLVNKGPDKATNIEVNEIMEDSLVLRSYMASYGDFNEETKTWSIDELDVGESASLKIDAVADGVGTASNNVSVTSDNYDPDLTNNEDGVSINVTQKPTVAKKLNVPSSNKKTNAPYHGVIQNHVSGNPLAIMLISLVSLLLLPCGMHFSKKR